jgi:imidazolonepropionase-like amidohydrolase
MKGRRARSRGRTAAQSVSLALLCAGAAVHPCVSDLEAQGRNPGSYVITDATIVPVVGEPIPRGSVLVRDGRIAAVGPSVAAPADATRIEGAGLFVYPGLIDSGTQLGLTEISSVPGGEDRQELGEFNAQNDALTAVNPHSEHIPVTRVNGVTTAITAAGGGLVSGNAALMDLWGWTPQEMAILPQAGMVVTVPRLPVGGGFGAAAAQQSPAQQRERVQQQTRALRRFLADARAYADVKARIEAGGGGRQEINHGFESMVPVMQGRAPVVFDVETAEQIRTALELADSFNLRVILRGASEAWRLADTLAARRVPVIVGPTTRAPGPGDPYDMIYANPGVLARAGVLIAFRTASSSDAHSLPYQAALATAYGLPADEAIRAMTINAARIWGVEDRLGSIEVGKVANLILTTGNPLDLRTEIRRVLIRGEPIPMESRHTRLYEQFRNRPRQP